MAYERGDTETLKRLPRYTGVYNVLDYSAVSFRSGVSVDSATDTADSREPFSEVDAQVQASCKFLSMCLLRLTADLLGCR